ncbi:MAG: hypothetical protein QM736_01450 [Vicinamibacterales bacterium]
MSSDSEPLRFRRSWVTVTLAGVGALALVTVASVWGHHHRLPRAGAYSPTHLRVPVPSEMTDDEPVSGESDPGVLRVCADGNNLPFTNRAGEGFENRLAELLAADLGRSLQYYWWPQRRGFVRQTLNAARCDVILGIPARSTSCVDDTSVLPVVVRLRVATRLNWFARSTIRVFVVCNLACRSPATTTRTHPRSRRSTRHIVDNVRPFLVYGDYSKPSPLAGLIDEVANGDIDVAIAWGPTAGFFARAARVRLDLVPVEPVGRQCGTDVHVSDPRWPYGAAIERCTPRSTA